MEVIDDNKKEVKVILKKDKTKYIVYKFIIGY